MYPPAIGWRPHWRAAPGGGSCSRPRPGSTTRSAAPGPTARGTGSSTCWRRPGPPMQAPTPQRGARSARGRGTGRLGCWTTSRVPGVCPRPWARARSTRRSRGSRRRDFSNVLSSWVAGADGSGFPAEHLPLGVFSAGGEGPRVGARIGDQVLDLARLSADGLVGGATEREAFAAPTLNPFLALGPANWQAVRDRVTELVCDPAGRERVTPALAPGAAVTVHLPIAVADYVDFYSSIEHATNLGRMFRPDAEPLLPNWRHLPVAYHGRAGTVVVSGTPVVRPAGQRRSGE